MRLTMGLLLVLAGCGDKEDSGAVDGDGDGHLSDVDCDDADPTVYPDAPEVCDGVDNDCDGNADDDDARLADGEGRLSYADNDGDRYGNPTGGVMSCEIPDGFVENTDDCDDRDPAVHPAAEEVCDTIDNDCDGLVDDEDDSVDLATGSTFYADTDADGFGDPGADTRACSLPAGHVADSTDCDDADPLVSPAGEDVCDRIDNDCDGEVDEGLDIALYVDSDGDGFGDDSTLFFDCELTTGEVTVGGDCDDADNAVRPGGAEVCDGIDNDCDALTDDDDDSLNIWTRSVFYVDADGDGYGDSSLSVEACSAPSGYVADKTDCDDAVDSTYPTATESCVDEVDNDCDRKDDCADSDCAAHASCQEDCASGIDEDRDGLVDCEDGDCIGYPTCVEDCTSEKDDDGDGLVDCDDDDCIYVDDCPHPAGYRSRVAGGNLWQHNLINSKDGYYGRFPRNRYYAYVSSVTGTFRLLPPSVAAWSSATTSTVCAWSVDSAYWVASANTGFVGSRLPHRQRAGRRPHQLGLPHPGHRLPAEVRRPVPGPGRRRQRHRDPLPPSARASAGEGRGLDWYDGSILSSNTALHTSTRTYYTWVSYGTFTIRFVNGSSSFTKSLSPQETFSSVP